MPTLERRDWLLLLFLGSSEPIDRVRIQKTMFLFSERSQAPALEKYSFEPYLYGPFSFALYPELDQLVQAGWLREEMQSGRRSPRYLLTSSGVSRATELSVVPPAERLELLHGLREWVMARPFAKLLRDIYSMYPDYARRSVFQR
jgi:hypothetical protein